jgi:hypothetical protein
VKGNAVKSEGKRPDLLGKSLVPKDLNILLGLFRKYGKKSMLTALKEVQTIPKGKAGRKAEFDPLREIILWGLVQAKKRSQTKMSIRAACDLVIRDNLRILGTTRSIGRLEARYHEIDSKLKKDPELLTEAEGIAIELGAR